MNDRRRPPTPPATNVISAAKRSGYPSTTGLQAWTASMLAQLETARTQLDPREYETLLDCIGVAIARETVRRLLPAEAPDVRRAA